MRQLERWAPAPRRRRDHPKRSFSVGSFERILRGMDHIELAGGTPVDSPLFELHRDLLVLPNAWDALSARLVEAAGAKAIATTSAAVAWKDGYPDGQHLPFAAHERTVAEIARVVHLPLTIDIERGYSDVPDEVAEAVARLVAAGASGVNLEDGDDPELLVAKIAAVKARLGRRVFLNARTDGATDYLARAAQYDAAGADGFFPIRLHDPEDIRVLVTGTRLPVNILLVPAGPTLTELAALGVRRVSAGPGIARAAYSTARNAARAMLGGEPVGDLGYPEANALLAPRDTR